MKMFLGLVERLLRSTLYKQEMSQDLEINTVSPKFYQETPYLLIYQVIYFKHEFEVKSTISNLS